MANRPGRRIFFNGCDLRIGWRIAVVGAGVVGGIRVDAQRQSG
jgi:hypothetical protein